MSAQAFVLFLTGGGALLALWLVVRFPERIPRSGRGVSLGLVGLMAVVLTVPHAMMLVGIPLGRFVAAFFVALPAATYIWLVIAWLMLYVQRAIAPRVR